MWTEQAGMVGLGDLDGGAFESRAEDVSADGERIVGTGHGLNGFEAFLWDSTNGMIGLGDLPGGSSSSTALAISADGSRVVGRSVSALSSPFTEGVYWDVMGGIHPLGAFPGGGFATSANGISADGSVIVGGATTGNDNEAFIWTEEGGIRNLETLLFLMGVTGLEGWNLTTADAISDDGKTITGWGFNPNGDHEAWIAAIPEPSTALSLSLGLAGLGLRRHISRASRE